MIRKIAKEIIRLGSRVTKVIAPFITPERVLIFLLASTAIGIGLKLDEARRHVCPESEVIAEVICPEVEPIIIEKIVIVYEELMCPTPEALIHPNPNCYFAVFCEEE